MERNCGSCRYGDKTDVVTKRTHCIFNDYWAFSHESCGYWEERQGALINSDDALKYKSFYCDRCVNKPDPDPPACPCYELLVQYGCVTGHEYDRTAQAILRLFFPPHPTEPGKLDQCRMFVEKKLCRDCTHWHNYRPHEDFIGHCHCASDSDFEDLLIDSLSAIPGIHTGAEFGCIHWTKIKPKNGQNRERSDDEIKNST